jgi:hypothetical protein
MTRCSLQTTPCRRIYGWIFNGIRVKGQQIIASENGDMELFLQSVVALGERDMRKFCVGNCSLTNKILFPLLFGAIGKWIFLLNKKMLRMWENIDFECCIFFAVD